MRLISACIVLSFSPVRPYPIELFTRPPLISVGTGGLVNMVRTPAMSVSFTRLSPP